MSGFPNKQQRKAIEHRGCPLVVVAGPGTGKTRTLVERARTILADRSTRDVAFVTFTRTSRRDTKRKLSEVLGKDRARRRPDFPRVSTLHRFAKSLVHKAPAVVGLRPNFSVLVPEREQVLVLNEVIRDLACSVSPKILRRAVASKKNTGVVEAPTAADGTELLKAVEHYEKLCDFYNTLDIEGLVAAATEVVKSGRVKIPSLYFHVDEYQDFNLADQCLVRALLESGTHEIVVVGDDDQSIYGFRDARPEGIREVFAKGDWEKIVFTKCHRLPPHILRASQALIRHHRGPRLDKPLEIPKDDQLRISTFLCTTDQIEMELVAGLIARELSERKTGSKKLSYRDLMILCPTKTISNLYAVTLKGKWGIPVRKLAPRSIPEDLWRILLVLRMAQGDDHVALRQWLEILGLVHQDIIALRDSAKKNGKTLFHVVRESKEKRLRKFIKGLKELQEIRGDLPKLLEKARFLAGVSTLPFEVVANTLPGLIAELYEDYGLFDSEDGDVQSDEVLVTTLHSSKGLEAEVVFIVQLNSRYMPNPSRDPDEELRVLYVAMTRAKQALYFSSPYIFDPVRNRKVPSMSSFLEVIKPHLSIQICRRRNSKKKK